jgi:membrane protease YdiL (CAAX protease family)
MSNPSSPPRRSLWERVFFAPDDMRLRVGWRLLVHLVLVFILSTFLLMFTGLESPVAQVVPLLAVIAATWLARSRLDHRSLTSLGFQVDRRMVLDLLLGFMLPALLIGLIFIVQQSMGWLQIESLAWERAPAAEWLPDLLAMLVIFLSIGIQEELLSRGYQLQNLAEAMNLHWGLFLSSIFFSLLHIQNPNASWASILVTLVSGYFLAFGWVRTGRLWLPIGLHVGWNFFQGSVFGFPVSGLEVSTLISHRVQGPILMTGGAYGPEASLLSLPAMALGSLLIWAYTRKRKADPSTMDD